MSKESPNWDADANSKPKTNKYQPYAGPLTDSTVMNFGKYKGVRLIDIPNQWFRWYKEDAGGIKNEWLLNYIEENWDVLKRG